MNGRCRDPPRQGGRKGRAGRETAGQGGGGEPGGGGMGAPHVTGQSPPQTEVPEGPWRVGDHGFYPLRAKVELLFECNLVE